MSPIVVSVHRRFAARTVTRRPLCMASLLFWFFALVQTGNFVYEVHAELFDVSRDPFHAIDDLGLVMAKLNAFWFFLVPYIGLRIALRARTQ